MCLELRLSDLRPHKQYDCITQIPIKHILRNKGMLLGLAQDQIGLSTLFLCSVLLLENVLHYNNQSPYLNDRSLKPFKKYIDHIPHLSYLEAWQSRAV